MISRRTAFCETALVFLVFFVQGAWPVPDVNEPTYLGKAIHYWNPEWIENDFFLESADTHAVFYFTFGWLSLVLSPLALAWIGRLLTWGLLAWSWRRLSAAVVPLPWLAVLTATMLVMLVQRCNVAGEWIIGGVEGKGFAFVFVFLALEAVVVGRWNRAWILLGVASAFHVLVGGWSAVALGIAWLVGRWEDRKNKALAEPVAHSEEESTPGSLAGALTGFNSPLRLCDSPQQCWPSLGAMAPGLLAGFLLSLPGLIPALRINGGANLETVCEANRIYVFERLVHHLDPWRFPPEIVLLFGLLCVAWFALRWATGFAPPWRRLRGFVDASILLAGIGLVVSLSEFVVPQFAAALLRFYWFRLVDFAVPLGLSLLGVGWLAGCGTAVTESKPSAGPRHESNRASGVQAERKSLWHPSRYLPKTRRGWLTLVIALAVFHGVDCGLSRLAAGPARAERLPRWDAWEKIATWATHPQTESLFPRQPRPDRLADYAAWRRACEWIAQPGNIPPGAIFLTPRMAQTFKWYAGRAEVVNWKEIPQDAASIVGWLERAEDIHGSGLEPPDRWYQRLEEVGAERLRKVADKYHADYAIMEVPERPLPFTAVYQNEGYVIYRLR